MLKNLMHRLGQSKIFCLIFSIALAIALWFYIGLVENPEDSYTISNIPLTFTGVEALDSRNLMLADGQSQTVSLQVFGKRTVAGRLDNSNMTAYIDLSNVRSAGDYTQAFNVAFPEWVEQDSVKITGWNPRNVSYSIIQRSNREIEVEAKLVGEVAEGFQLGEISCLPNRISVSGPNEVIRAIDHAEVRLEREKVDKSISTTAPFILLDNEGNEISMEGLVFGADEVAVEIEILTVKEVPLTVDLIAGGGATDKDVVVEILPKTVTLSGDATTMAGISKISLGTVDISKFTMSLEQNMTIPFPDDVNNLSGVSTAKVTLTVSDDFSTKRVTVPAEGSIEVMNAEGMDYEIITESLDVTVRGKTNILDKINESNVRIVVDMVDLSDTKGLVPVKAKVYVDGYSTAGAIGDYTVMIQIS